MSRANCAKEKAVEVASLSLDGMQQHPHGMGHGIA